MQAPTNFQQLYKCNIGLTGERIYKARNDHEPNRPLSIMEKVLLASEPEIAIKMPESEYLRFMENWNMYMQIINASQHNNEIKEQFQHLMVMSNMLT
jgi:hypothetical protein